MTEDQYTLGLERVIRRLEADNDRLSSEVERLSEGGCRFNCRTSREAFEAGFRAFALQMNLMNSNEEIDSASYLAYRKWRDK